MDANGTRYHLLLGETDWNRCVLSPELEWDPDRAELRLRESVFQFVAPPADRKPAPEDRRGAACDRFGNWYWIGADQRGILVLSAGSDEATQFWPVDGTACTKNNLAGEFQQRDPDPPAGPARLQALAVTEDHHLVAGVLDPPGLLVFDLYGGGEPVRMRWPGAGAFVPLDMAARPGGGLYILDAAPLETNSPRYWTLDRRLMVLSETGAVAGSAPPGPFTPVEPGTGKEPPRHIPDSLQAAATPVTAAEPVGIEALPDGSVLILDRNPAGKFSRILRYVEGKPAQEFSLDVMKSRIDPDERDRFRLIAHDFAFVADFDALNGAEPDRLFIAASGGNQVYSFHLYFKDGVLRFEPLPRYFPLRRFDGKALVAWGRGAFYDSTGMWAPLAEQPRPRHDERGVLTTQPLDGGDPECVWHRLMLDGAIPPDAAVLVRTRTAETQSGIERAEWSNEPDPYLRGGSELPFAPVVAGRGAGVWELLFQRARGRWLQIELTLAGDGRSTPRLGALRAYYPRFSYLKHYIPAVYREDDQSASFLERMLANMEGLFTTIEDKIAAAQMLFDLRSAPAETLDWLATWFGVVLDPAWDETRRRLFLRHAAEFFAWRGTPRGLRMALRLALDEQTGGSLFEEGECAGGVRIIERFRTRRLPGVFFGDPTEPGSDNLALVATWQPGDGVAKLDQRFRAAVPSAMNRRYPIRVKAVRPKQAIPEWRQFSRETLGFVPSATAADLEAWQDFLARRYRAIARLNTEYGSAYAGFAAVPLPRETPAGGAPLEDWYDFESDVLIPRRNAHRFTVLVPVGLKDRANATARAARYELARRVAALEKPAHTIFDVKFYWVLFRVGAARLGLDSHLDLGGRAPELMTPAVLGQAYLAESYIAPRPGEPANRLSVGCAGARGAFVKENNR